MLRIRTILNASHGPSLQAGLFWQAKQFHYQVTPFSEDLEPPTLVVKERGLRDCYIARCEISHSTNPQAGYV